MVFSGVVNSEKTEYDHRKLDSQDYWKNILTNGAGQKGQPGQQGQQGQQKQQRQKGQQAQQEQQGQHGQW